MELKKPEVWILILDSNQKEKTLACLNSIGKLAFPNYKVLLVINGYSELLNEEVLKLHPSTTIIRNRINLGCSGGRNIGIGYFLSRTNGDYLFFLDNDTIIDSMCVDELVSVAESDTRIGVAGMKIYYNNSSDKFWQAGGAMIDWYRGFFKDHGQGEFDIGQYDNRLDVDCVPGGFTFIKRKVLERVGLLDERYFIYYEDTDWCVRVRKAGFRIVFVPGAKIWHCVSSSLNMESPAFYYYRSRNQLLFLINNCPKIYLPFALSFLTFSFMYSTFLTLYLSKKILQLRATIIGQLDFLMGRYGQRTFTKELLEESLIVKLIFRLKEKIFLAVEEFIRNQNFKLKRLFRKELNILVKLDWNLGDEIMMLPVYKALKNQFLNSKIFTETRYPELFKNSSFVDGVNPQSSIFDKVIDLKYDSRHQNRLSYVSEKIKLKIEDKVPFLDLADEEVKNCQFLIRKNTGSPLVAISTGANWKSRQWGSARFKRVAESLVNTCNAEIVELGKDCESIGVGENLINKTSVRDAAIVLKKCNLFIGSDSGLAHLSLAVKTPAIVLFGPLSPESLISVENDKVCPLRSGVDCHGCWSRGEMVYPDCCPRGLPNCMESITEEEVVTKAKSLINENYRSV